MTFTCSVPDCKSRAELDPATADDRVDAELAARGWQTVRYNGHVVRACPGCRALSRIQVVVKQLDDLGAEEP